MEKKMSMKFPGIILKGAESVWKGETRKIRLPKKYTKALGKNLYYMNKKDCYGILRIAGRIKEDVYKIEILDRFESPKPIEINSESFLIDDVKFLEVTTQPSVRGAPIGGGSGLQPIWIFGKRKKGEKLSTTELIKLIEYIEQYDPKKQTNNQLTNDWEIVKGWYFSYKEMEDIKLSRETIVNLAKLIYSEIKERKMEYDFKLDEMKMVEKELYKIISEGLEERDLKFLDNLDDFLIIKDCVSLIDYSKKDINLLIRIEEPTEFIKKAIETRLAVIFPEELQKKLNFVWGEKEISYESFIPLFDIQLKRIRPVKMITMIQDKSSKIKLMEPYIPQKSSNPFYDLNKFIEILT